MDRLPIIEHKLNLILTLLSLKFDAPLDELTSFGAPSSFCPVCQSPTRFVIDVERSEVAMSCGCKPPIQAVKGLSGLLNPPSQAPRKRESEGDPNVDS